MIENPYEPTALFSLPAKSLVVSRFRKNLVYASKFVFWLGMIKFFLGSMISFMPGAETSWFIITAGLASGGFLVSSKYYRIAALVIFAICVFAAYSGYHRGIEYQERVRQRFVDKQYKNVLYYVLRKLKH